MTYLNFEWNGDKYVWDLYKAGRCTIGYIIIFVTGYHFLHVVIRLMRDLNGVSEEDCKSKNNSDENKGLLENENRQKQKKPVNKKNKSGRSEETIDPVSGNAQEENIRQITEDGEKTEEN